MMRPLGPGSDGRAVAEVGAFCIAPACRGAGKGDSLLDYLGAYIARLQQTPVWLQPCTVLLPPRGAKTCLESTHVPASQSGRRVHRAWAAWCC